MTRLKHPGWVSGTALTLLGVAACGGNSTPSSQGSPSTRPSTTRTAPALASTSFTSDFSAMSALKDLASQGKGKIGVLLPETTTSARYTAFDAPYWPDRVAKEGRTGTRLRSVRPAPV